MAQCPSCCTTVPRSSRFCMFCGHSMTPAAGPASASTLIDPASPPAFTSSDAIHHGRFLPVTLLAGRYRILGLLGRGGMGEVYRADDLKLRQQVALKFLPAALAVDPARLSRFHDEVRLARQVSHPGTCRVYDIGVANGLHFISMEYVDGEDLASLLRRIGRLPRDKAVEMARQLFAGLAAAHDAGILHRDLKPANVMIDGRGRARITDFGLAGVAGDVRGDDIRAGTPRYMAPEQLAGRQVSVRSDIYSLGLVLYEMVTGRPAFLADSLASLTREKEESAPPRPSSIVPGMDPALEKVILLCLEKDPRARPSSALAVAAALPGGDPLSAALAAGETPSPEMVAAAGEEGSLRPAAALAYLACVVLGLAVLAAISGGTTLFQRAGFRKPPAALSESARRIIARLGHGGPAVDEASGFLTDVGYLRYLQERDPSPTRWDRLAQALPPATTFWYRSSPQHMFAWDPTGRVDLTMPAPLLPGMSLVQMDAAERMVKLLHVPEGGPGPPPGGPPDWSVLFREAGLEPTSFTSAEPLRPPPVHADATAAWEGLLPGGLRVPVRLEAGAFQGRPVYFKILAPWSERSRPPLSPRRAAWGPLPPATQAVFVVALAGGLLLARRNLRLGRGDRRGAFLVAFVVFSGLMLSWILRADHVPAPRAEWDLFLMALSWALYAAGVTWLFYLALEPVVRRTWPEIVISWSRLLAGRFRDPLVGQSMLAGALVGVAARCVGVLSFRIPEWLGRTPPAPAALDTDLLLGTGGLLSGIPLELSRAVTESMLLVFVLVLLRAVLRKRWAAVTAFGLIVMAMTSYYEWGIELFVVFNAAVAAAVTICLVRFGGLSLAAAGFTHHLLAKYPITLDPAAWYLGCSIVALAVVLLVALYGFRTSLAGRPAFQLLEDEAPAG